MSNLGSTSVFDWTRIRLLPARWKSRPGYVVIPITILVAFVFIGVFGPWLAPHSPTEIDLGARYQPPVWDTDGSWDRPLGADAMGRDILSRMIHGARVSLIFALSAVALSGAIGSVLGLLAGYYGSWIDAIIMRLVDIVLSLPLILIAMAIVVVMGQSLFTMILVVSLLSWAGYTRIARAETLSLKERDFVALARTAGVSAPRIMVRHIFPNLVNTLVVLATLATGGIILLESTLSFLGVGVPPPDPAWGTMVADGRQVLDSAWWVSVFPGVCIGAVVLSVSLFGDWLRDKLDPRLRQV